MPLRGRSGRRVWCCPDLPPDCVYELVTSHKEQLTNEIHRCGMYWHGVRIWVVSFGPEEVRQKIGDGERGSNLPKSELSQSTRDESEEDRLTAMQKNRTKNPISRNGVSNHPTPLNTAKNTISIGSVTMKSVPMTSLRLGFLLRSSHLFGEVEAEGRADMAE